MSSDTSTCPGCDKTFSVRGYESHLTQSQDPLCQAVYEELRMAHTLFERLQRLHGLDSDTESQGDAQEIDIVIVYTISHLTFISFISCFTVVLYAQTFVIVYSHTYLTQSPNIALLSCLLRTLGIVSYIYAQYISCLLRTLALCCLVLASRNLAVTFCTLSHTRLVSGYGPRPLDASQISF